MLTGSDETTTKPGAPSIDVGRRRKPCATQADPALIEALRQSSSAAISDNLARLQAAVGLRPFHSGGILVGTAVTVRTRAGDNLCIHEAIAVARPGDVIVVDGGGDTSRAVVGEIVASLAEHKGCAGLVIDGAIRDCAAIGASAFPVFALAATPRGPSRQGPGEVNVPVAIGGLVIQPGDIVVGDADGVVAFPAAIAVDLLEALHAQDTREREIMRSIREGVYRSDYGAPR